MNAPHRASSPPVSVEAALDRLLTLPVALLETEAIPLDAALDRVLARDVVAPVALPGSDQSAMDGYALAGKGHSFTLVGEASAGHPYPGHLAPGTAVRIMTGALVPSGADRVAMQECCLTLDGSVVVQEQVQPGANIRRTGEDIATGEPVLAAGTLLTPWHIGAASALGFASLPVRRKLRIALMSTGDELAGDGSIPVAGQIHDSNRPMIRALLASYPITLTDLGIVADDSETTRQKLRAASSDHDLILSIGGMSVGDRDHVGAVIGSEGGFAFWNVAIKPGKPVALGHVGDVPVLGLPGNPVSAALCFLLFARPFILHLAGARPADHAPLHIPARAGFARKRRTGRREYLRGRLEIENGVAVARPFAKDGSAMLSSLLWATGFIEVPEDAGAIAIGDPVRFLPFSSLMQVSP